MDDKRIDTHASPALRGDTVAAHPWRWLARLAREPFVHFVFLGALLFGVFALIDKENPGGGRIDITAADIEQLNALFSVRWGRAPSSEEMKGLVEDLIREEVLYREAILLGLDKDDTIVRRRLAQKLEFLAADVAAMSEPDETSLQDYYARNQDLYREPARLSFSQVYFSTDKRGAHADAEAMAQLKHFQAGAVIPARAHDYGDPSLLASDHHQRSLDEITREFGTEFADALARLPVGSWQGPVSSSYGVHLVYVGARTDSRVPMFSEVRDRVARDYVSELRRTANDKVYERLRSRYEISVADNPSPQVARAGEQ